MGKKTKTPAKLTPAQFYKKYGPDISVNGNCLQDVACSKCGNRDIFYITAMSTFEMEDDGTTENDSVDYNEKNHTKCGSCDHEGKYAEFTIEGLDEFLEEKASDL